jgi:hypothetical protein
VWTGSWHILLTAYVILVLLAGLIIMSYQTLQARYTVKELAPRLPVGYGHSNVGVVGIQGCDGQRDAPP